MKKTHRGFALLVAIIFMSVMLSFGLALGSLSYKQQVLASGAIESQYAFYVADAALECALYADQQNNGQPSFFTYNGDSMASAPSLVCGGATTAPGYPLPPVWSPSQWIITTRLSYDGGTHCADVIVYKPKGNGTTYLYSQGYNVSCATVSNPNGARYVSRGENIHY